MNTPLPRPRVLFVDVPDHVYAAMEPYAPTHERVTKHDDIHPSDWDLIVADGSYTRPFEIPHLVTFGADATSGVELDGVTLAKEVIVPDNVPKDVRRLVETTLLPALGSPPRKYWTGTRSLYAGLSGRRYAVLHDREFVPRTGLRKPEHTGTGWPLLTAGAEQHVLAFWSIQNDRSLKLPRHVLALPRETLHPESWLRILLERLQGEDPSRFPPGIAWRDKQEWAPPALRAAHESVEQIARERAELLADLDRRNLEAQELVEAQKSAAEHGPWRLLTEDGPELEDAVQKTLQVLGFEVEVRDETGPQGAKLEDLRVTDPDIEDWTCLVEIKGYTKGAKAGDVMQVAGNPQAHFAAKNGRLPDKLWHVVNPERNTPPDQRRPAFPNPDLELAQFTALDGLVIDTRELLQAAYAVEHGSVPAEVVRKSLRESVQLWTSPTS